MPPKPPSSHFLPARRRKLADVVSPSRAPLSYVKGGGGAARFLHDGPDTVEELLDRHLVKKTQSDDDEVMERQRLTSTRREALSLYRDILRATRFFSWPDADGVVWRDVLRSNARREFEEARFERDPEIITRLLIGGRDAVQSALDRLADAQRKRIAEEDEERRRGGR